MTDTRLVYSVRGTWWDSIDKVATTPNGLPVCPHCQSPLFEMGAEAWWEGVDRHEAFEPGYRAMIEWSRGKCFRDYVALEDAYKREIAND